MLSKIPLKYKLAVLIITPLLIAYVLCLPNQLFDVPYATVIESRDGRLLDAHIASDDQWRFPEVDSVPIKYKKCLLAYEDEHFYLHPGFNPISIIKAIKQNIDAGEVVRGGSTITQQVIRLARNKDRTYIEKIIELIWATRLEIKYSKDQILKLYASHAPFGGNVIGLDMASWRYFGRKPHQLSWAESATLAVLPNAPGLIYPGKREHLLKQKRDLLLLKLYQDSIINIMDYELAISESVPTQDFKVPQLAPHFLQRCVRELGTRKITTTIDFEMQELVNRLVYNHHNILKQNGINNLAMLVLDIKDQSVAAYVGNAPTTAQHQKDVDIITAPRSTGSVLKPFLYAAMLDHAELLPHSLVQDTPTVIDGYKTQNFDNKYSGAVPASQALARSLNVPAVRMLQQYGVGRFYNKLQDLDQTHINRGVGTYGLSLIIGGAESSLWDMSKAYLALATILQDYTRSNSEYNHKVMSNLHYIMHTNDTVKSESSMLNAKTYPVNQTNPNILGAASIYHTFEAMKKVNRPEGEEIWHFFNPNNNIAWKTGTSYGNRDAWAIGVTPRYVIGVWTGNADGEGRAAMTGIDSAAPVLFDLFNRLPTSDWFDQPFDDMIETDICEQSGYLATTDCNKVKQWIPTIGERYQSCPYHHIVHLDPTQNYRVNADCQPISQLVSQSWFILPPTMAWYYKKTHPAYKTLPDYRSDCIPPDELVMSFLYPTTGTVITQTVNVDGSVNKIVIELAHKNTNSTVYWYLDGKYITSTKGYHQINLNAPKGKHTVTALDQDGNEVQLDLEFV